MSRTGTPRNNASTPLLPQGVSEDSTKPPGLESESSLSNGPHSTRQTYGSIGEPDAGQSGCANILRQPIKPGIDVIINSLHISYITMLEVTKH